MVILKKCLLATITLEKSDNFLDIIVQSSMEIHMLEHPATENMLGILSAQVQREEPKNTAKAVNLLSALVVVG